MKRYLFLYAVCATALLVYGYRRHRAEVSRLGQNQTALAAEVERYRNRLGEAAASAQALRLRCAEYEELRAADAERIRRLGIRLRRLEATATAVAATEVGFRAPLAAFAAPHDSGSAPHTAAPRPNDSNPEPLASPDAEPDDCRSVPDDRAPEPHAGPQSDPTPHAAPPSAARPAAAPSAAPQTEPHAAPSVPLRPLPHRTTPLMPDGSLPRRIRQTLSGGTPPLSRSRRTDTAHAPCDVSGAAPRTFRWSDAWVTVEGVVTGDSVRCRVQSVDTLRQIVHRVPRRFLFFRWGTKAIRQEISSSNPHTRIVWTEYIRLER